MDLELRLQAPEVSEDVLRDLNERLSHTPQVWSRRSRASSEPPSSLDLLTLFAVCDAPYRALSRRFRTWRNTP